jgi:hypothetical protein
LRGTPWRFAALPIFQTVREKEMKMIGAQQASVGRTTEFEEGTSALGLTLEDVVELLIAGVKVTELMGYAEAVASNRLN